jgi:hypothetical protein
MADDWWAHQQGLRQTLRTEVAVGRKGPDAQLDEWAITIRYENAKGAWKVIHDGFGATPKLRILR